ncbi:large conductance mechanosensitive channel protein MscL [Kordia sp.]|uniref:large conductance mechanosensitive channel protein MscL n=1 Tax=Kordia sp. TaxID=1965332 RepID=UPI003D28D9B3
MKMKLFKEFKEFAVKGNMIDIAVGVIIGGAFNKVIDVLVKEVFLPPLSLLTDGINWSNKKLILREAITIDGVVKPQEVAIAYGKLFEVLVDFLIIGFTVFLVVKVMNSMRNKAEDPKNATVVTPKNIELLNRMTELLEKQVEIAERNTANNAS